jgi:hypothetical protein
MVLRSASLNHVNTYVHLALAYKSLSPSNNKPQWAALVAVPVEVS